MENIYVQFYAMVYQQIFGIPMSTNCAPLIADLFLYCYERDFMSNLQKSKRFDLIDKFNDASRYLNDILTNIYNGNIFPSLNPAKIFQFISRWIESTKSSAVGPNHRAVINTSNAVKSPLLWEFWIYNSENFRKGPWLEAL